MGEQDRVMRFWVNAGAPGRLTTARRVAFLWVLGFRFPRIRDSVIAIKYPRWFSRSNLYKLAQNTSEGLTDEQFLVIDELRRRLVVYDRTTLEESAGIKG